MSVPTDEVFSEAKVLVVVGRSPDLSHFAESVSSLLFDNFTLVVAQPLEDDIGADGKIRFIGFVTGEEIEGRSADNQAMRFKPTGGDLSARVYPDVETAMTDAKERYGFDNGGGALAEHAEKMKEMLLRFPKFTANELEASSVFDSLVNTGRLTLIRGLYDEQPVCVLAMVTSNEEESEVKFNPLAILVTSIRQHRKLELPFFTMDST